MFLQQQAPAVLALSYQNRRRLFCAFPADYLTIFLHDRILSSLLVFYDFFHRFKVGNQLRIIFSASS